VDRWATFDCYGTLIDWNAGLRTALAGIWPDDDSDALLASYHEAEPGLEADGKRSYREVLTRAVVDVGAARGLAVPDGADVSLASSVSSWPPFPEVPASLGLLREDGWRLAILSNTDADYLDASLSSIGVPVDERVVASEIGSLQAGVRPLGDVLPADRRRPRRPRPRGGLVVPRRRARRGARAPMRVDQPARRVEPDPEGGGTLRPVGAARDT
jgi:hypothetical protein